MIVVAERTGDPLAVALFDVDRFESINDVYGHLDGDAVLVGLAQLMREQAPPETPVVRWGGRRSSSLPSSAPTPRRDWRSPRRLDVRGQDAGRNLVRLHESPYDASRRTSHRTRAP